MYKSFFCAVLAAFPLTAQADEAFPIHYDGQVLDRCLANTVPEARRDCIGKAADACMQATPEGASNAGMGLCAGFEHDDWDARLNAAYQSLMAVEKAQDADMADLGSSVPQMAPALQEMQRAWIAYRDAACTYEVSQWGGGTGSGPAWAFCTMQMTGEQTLVLLARLADKGQ
ncbi:uncharacterized protein YecT (DUF1311 family) [Rhodobacter aestuarii]|uniref:Uncharacterized conserved protein YecT, DUF1311 family n=1 Tax=Rhodobacter aestuarii TaxID=453582 RepID=A0A1N7P6W7_9RHOB|nr:lysozyme inhibitor LprI family protein [Rhodobacter aestuarii]PTV97623.1 uncharacterized protein YecT (DUF1311 family) [Rhodobacter aestuarii]SIT06189.1 Uncharacterized conserved protein YecT, DUF1311 family [Rhodobacter aestuarii]